jgi:hypothetical protein
MQIFANVCKFMQISATLMYLCNSCIYTVFGFNTAPNVTNLLNNKTLQQSVTMRNIALLIIL